MKILNRNNKLKRSKMFINEQVYRDICDKYDTTLEKHLERVEKIKKDEYVLDQRDICVISDVYTQITKIVR